MNRSVMEGFAETVHKWHNQYLDNSYISAASGKEDLAHSFVQAFITKLIKLHIPRQAYRFLSKPFLKTSILISHLVPNIFL